MEFGALIGGLLVTILGGVTVYLIQRWLEKRDKNQTTDSEAVDISEKRKKTISENNTSSSSPDNKLTVRKILTRKEINNTTPAVINMTAQSNPTNSKSVDLNYMWHDQKTIICNVGGIDLFLQGLNAQLFAHAVNSQLFISQLPSDKTIQKRIFENLALSLATIDRQYSEPATIFVIQSLWIAEKFTGIKMFIDFLSKRQWKDTHWDGYRDHLNHMLKVYISGLYLFEKCTYLRETLLLAANCDSEKFIKNWLYASTFHDIGYIFELPGVDKGYENFKIIQEYMQNFLYYHDQDLAEDLTSEGINPKTIDKKYARQIFNLLNVHLREIQTADDLGESLNRSINLWDQIDELCKGTGIGEHGISEYFKLCLTQSPAMVNKRPPFFDHGIIGALLLMYIGYNKKVIFENISTGLQNDESGKAPLLEKTGRGNVLRKMVEWAGDPEKNIGIIEEAATAIALHNIDKDAWKVDEIPWKVDLPNYWIDINKYPLAFFLVMVDVIQDWDRPGFNPTSTSTHEAIRGSEIFIQANTEHISIAYIEKPQEFDLTIRELKKLLKPDQIDKIFRFLAYEDLELVLFPKDPALQKYNASLVERLKGDWFSKFIDLYMELPIKLGTEQDVERRQFTINQIAEYFPNQPAAILGEPGAGKTTLVKKLIIDQTIVGQKTPVFIEMGKYLGEKSFEEFIDIVSDDQILKTMLNSGSFLIIFDGLNEAVQYLEEGSKALIRFIEKYPRNQYFITCRTAEYPPYLRKHLTEFIVLRISHEAVQNYLIQAMGESRGNELFNKLSTKIKNLCQNPLMLTMLTYIYLDEDPIASPIPSSKAILYKHFLQELYKREDELRFIYTKPSIREEFLGFIASKLENRTTVVKRGEVEYWISELYNDEYHGSGVNIINLIKEVTEIPPMKAIDIGRSYEDRISFMHQSFQEYYSALYLDKLFGKRRITIDEIVEYGSPKFENWWETLSLFVGLQSNATEVVKRLKEYAEVIAEKQSDQRTLALVARCIREAKLVEPEEVDDVIIRTLLTFKFGKVAFDYNLIYGLKLIEPDQRSNKFPIRLIEDVNWWLDKYARVQPALLDTATSISDLLNYIRKGDVGLSYDALFTIRYHPNRGKAASELINLLETSSGNLKEQVIVTLGYLESNANIALDKLLEIINEPRESKWARAYALNALGRIGSKKSVEPMIQYLLDHNNPYRDSASWSLQGLAKKNQEDTELYKRLRTVFLQALLTETNDLEGRYAKGNIVYTLGELNATEYVKELLDWLQSQSDPYVIEDGVQAIGQLRDPLAIPTITAHLKNEDPVVRIMAIDSLIKIEKANITGLNFLSLIAPLANDPFQIVRQHVDQAIKNLQITN